MEERVFWRGMRVDGVDAADFFLEFVIGLSEESADLIGVNGYIFVDNGSELI